MSDNRHICLFFMALLLVILILSEFRKRRDTVPVTVQKTYSEEILIKSFKYGYSKALEDISRGKIEPEKAFKEFKSKIDSSKK